jgi:hypothetical protein
LAIRNLTLFRMAIKKCGAERLGVIYDSQTTNRKKGGQTVRVPLPSAALLLVALKSYMTFIRPEYTKTPPQTGGTFYFFIEKSSKTAIFV